MSDSGPESKNRATGSCLCGDVSYQTMGPLRDVVACHCRQCRKTSGNYVAATRINDNELIIKDTGSLVWYDSSRQAKRGFCNRCGSNLFWKNKQNNYTGIMAGTLEVPTHLKLIHHIFVADASDYHPFHPDDVTFDQDDEHILK